jgi:hypothetical protein
MAVNNRCQRHHRRYRQRVANNRLVDRENPLEMMPETKMFKRFRFRPDTILFIVGLLLEPMLKRDTLRSCALPPLLQVLVTLRFLATGGFYSLIADTFNSVSAPSMCRVVGDVCRGLCQIAWRFVRMTSGTRAEETKQQLYVIGGKVMTNHNK